VVAVRDVTDSRAVEAVVATTVARSGRVDVVVDSAGISRASPFGQVALAQWREGMAADVRSVVLVTQAALPFLSERGGSVVNVASVAGLGGDPGLSTYTTATAPWST
jgi:meso-butanediol dehydrogenase/(S,S)-butanediol dehydrogenase/diacetyl reductase